MDSREISRPKPSASPDAIVDRLFQKMATMYGTKWAEMWVGVPMDLVKADWARALTGVSIEQMHLAIDAMQEQGRPFPPTQPEFVGLCRQFRKHGEPLRLIDGRRPAAPPGGFESLKAILARARPADDEASA